jgi:RNA polymerase sigma-70 factor (ECF subfamily)
MDEASMDEAGHGQQPDDEVAVARSGDDAAFGALVDRYRHELQVHCYRMLGSLTDAEDHVQETLLRAWRGRTSFAGRSTIRAWLYRIATNACLDTLRTHPERIIPVGGAASPPPSEIPWLQPYPDILLDRAGPSHDEPDALVVARETIELAYLAAIQLLPANQRAVLILRDVLGWSAVETAALLDTSVASVTSALQRARVTLKDNRPEEPAAWTPATEPSVEERALLQRYMDAHARADAPALVAMMRADVRFTMPPQPALYLGRVEVGEFLTEALRTVGEFRLVATTANRMPAAANYLRAPGDTQFRALALDVLRFVGGQLAEITTFEPSLFTYFGLPEIWSDPDD